MKKSTGFTLIELVVVIVILGILAVVAAPKFMAISSDARKATLNELASTLKTSYEMIHTKAILAGLDDSNDFISVNGEKIKLTGGYPSATQDGIVKGLNNPGEWHPTNPSIPLLGKIDGIMFFSQKPINNMSINDIINTNCYVTYEAVEVNKNPTGSSSDGWSRKRKIFCSIINNIDYFGILKFDFCQSHQIGGEIVKVGKKPNISIKNVGC